MTHILTEFDGVALPRHFPRYQHDPAPGESSLRRTTGGYFDTRGTDEGRSLSQIIPLTAMYIGEEGALVDESGEAIVDESGEAIIGGSALAILRAQVSALAEKVRKSGALWRQRADDGLLEWKTARLQKMTLPITSRNVMHAEITCSFESMMTNWHAETATTVTASVTSGATAGLTIENPASTIMDAVLTIERTSGTITNVAVACSDLDIEFTWAGSLGAGDILTIDDGAQTVSKSGAGAYSGWAASSAHLADSWLTIPFGNYLLLVTVTGGAADLEFSFYAQTP